MTDSIKFYKDANASEKFVDSVSSSPGEVAVVLQQYTNTKWIKCYHSVLSMKLSIPYSIKCNCNRKVQ